MLAPYSQPLFISLKSRAFAVLVLLLLACISLAQNYYEFSKLKAQSAPLISAEVLLQYQKSRDGEPYTVLKLKSDFGVFYTTSREDLRDLRGRMLSMRITTKKLAFKDFLSSFYAPSFDLRLLPQEPTLKSSLKEHILSQHKSELMGRYYLALFLADALPLQWRELAQAYGIAHLFAISGFHTGILGAIVFFAFGLLYYPLHARFFPYRNAFFDLGALSIAALLAYYFLLTSSPSYLRAVFMALAGFVLFWRGIEVLRVEILLWSVGVLLALFPHLAFSLGFYFSCLGVLYIGLFFRYFPPPARCASHAQNLAKRAIYAAALNASTFFLMGIIVYYIFGAFSPLSLFSLILTPLFVLYYPAVLIAHIFGVGGVFDELLLAWLNSPHVVIQLSPSAVLLAIMNLLSLAAIRFKAAFLALLFFNLSYFAYAIAAFVLNFG